MLRQAYDRSHTKSPKIPTTPRIMPTIEASLSVQRFNCGVHLGLLFYSLFASADF